MSIQELGSLGEIIAAIATVATLAYLAIQIRQSARVAQSQVERDVVNSPVTLAVGQDPDLARVFREGCADFEALSTDDRVRFAFLMTNLFASYQVHFGSHQMRLLSLENYTALTRTMESLIVLPGVTSWWRSYRFNFTTSFQNEVLRLAGER